VIIAAASSNLITNTGILNGSFLELDELWFGGPGVTQAIPGGTFDTWLSVFTDVPSGWEFFGAAVMKTTDAHSGTYAIELESTDDGSGGVQASGITSGHLGQNGSFGGQPFTSMADTLTGFYKYIPVGLDTGWLSVRTSALGSWVGGNGINFLPSAGYVYFELPVTSFSTPDTMIIDAESSTWPYVNAGIGSQLFLDGLQMKSTMVNVSQVEKHTLSCYPNPAGKSIRLQTGLNHIGKSTLTIRDLAGRIVFSENYESAGAALLVPVENFERGIYLLELQSEGTVFSGKFVKN